MEYAAVNCSGKIWLFWEADWEGVIISDTIQLLTIKFKHHISYKEVMITAVYVKCSAIKRLELWEELECLANDLQISWLVGGDFNVILDDFEKLGELPATQMEITDFAQCMNNCALTFPFTGSLYT